MFNRHSLSICSRCPHAFNITGGGSAAHDTSKNCSLVSTPILRSCRSHLVRNYYSILSIITSSVCAVFDSRRTREFAVCPRFPLCPLVASFCTPSLSLSLFLVQRMTNLLFADQFYDRQLSAEEFSCRNSLLLGNDIKSFSSNGKDWCGWTV